MFPIRGFIRNHRNLTRLVVLASALAGFAGWDLAAPIRGQLAARFDLTRGHYKVLTLGLPTSWRPEYSHLLRERYGIEMRVVAGCLVSQSLLAYVKGYNRVSMSAANRKFGRDVFQETDADAIRNWELQHAAAMGRK